jgi:cytoskeletal protein CcmA (bactofilin family)
MRGKSLYLFIGLTLALLGLVTRPADAADIRTGERVVIAVDEVIDDDLVVSAQFVEINGTVTGDLVATGTIILINGRVGGSAIVAAQSVEVRGTIDGSLYGAAYSLLLGEGAAVNRNVLFGGFSATTQANSQVSRDFHMAGYQMRHDGSIGGDLNVSAGALQINGTVGGDVTGEVSAPGRAAPPHVSLPNMPSTVTMLPSGLVVGPAAQIGGQMLAQEITPTARPTHGVLGLPLWLINRLGTVIGLLLVAIFLIALWPRVLPALSGALQRRPLPSLGWGLLIYILLFPAGILVGLILVVGLTLLFAMVTFGQLTGAMLGLLVGLFLFALFGFLFFTYVIAWLIVGHLLGRLLFNRANRPASRGAHFLYTLIGVLVLQGLRLVPVLGFIVAFFVGTLALGAVLVYWLDRQRPAKALPPAGAPGGEAV